jgi:nicotinate-nucleotide pyrophosphorylase (carboxylating)
MKATLPEDLYRYLQEDVGSGDITTEGAIPPGLEAEGEVLARESGILAGVEEVEALFRWAGVEVEALRRDGEEIERGEVLLRFRGEARTILSLERVALNLLMRMSGIATATRKAAEVCGRHGVRVAGTRKTTPGLRRLEKRAIALGGGEPHRIRLDDAVLLKDNHIALVGLREAIRGVKKRGFEGIEVEVSSLEEALEACEEGVDALLLDNLPPREVEEVLKALEERGLRKEVTVEVSGGVTMETLESYAQLKPDLISMGALTTRAPWLDLSLRIRRRGPSRG